MRKYFIKISLTYFAAFTAMMLLIQLSLALQIDPWPFTPIVNVFWLIMVFKACKEIKKETIKTKLYAYTAVFAIQLISFAIASFFSNTYNVLMILFSGMAMGITVLTMIFFIARSIQSEKFYMRALKCCIYIVFSLGIIILVTILGNVIINVPL